MTIDSSLITIVRILFWLIASLLVLVAAGRSFQIIATRADWRKYPAPGKLVDIGGYRLHIQCLGNGSPTVILDAAADMMSADWVWIQSAIAKQTRVCSYDRAGMGWSDPGPQPRDANQIVSELHMLLTNAGIPGPYVMVGHSAGGLYARLYAAEYPDEIVGMVLVDPGHPEMETRVPALKVQNGKDKQMVKLMRVLSYFGMTRLLDVGTSNAQGLPAQQMAEVNAAISTPLHWDALKALMDATSVTYDELRAVGPLGSKPLVVISPNTAWFTKGAQADDARRAINDLQSELAGLSTNGSQRIIEGATHGSLIHKQEDAQAVVNAIETVLQSVRTGESISK